MEGPKGAFVRALGRLGYCIFNSLLYSRALLATIPYIEPVSYFAVLTSPFSFSDVVAHWFNCCNFPGCYNCSCSYPNQQWQKFKFKQLGQNLKETMPYVQRV